MSRSCYGLVYRCLYDTVVALLLYHNPHQNKGHDLLTSNTAWFIIFLLLLQIWHEGQQETESSKYRFSLRKCQKTVKALRLRRPCLLQWFVSCRIILLKHAWTAWTHKDKQRETHNFCELFMPPPPPDTHTHTTFKLSYFSLCWVYCLKHSPCHLPSVMVKILTCQWYRKKSGVACYLRPNVAPFQ